jgi:MarR family transcriptional regulator, organic hydroperoxide resistance regulator
MGAHRSTRLAADARTVLDAIRRIVRALRLFDREAERTAGLSGAQVFVLQNLRGGKAISINELARRTHTDQSSVSVVVRKLAARKLLRRESSPIDGRSVVVSMTPAGRRRLQRSPAPAQGRLVGALRRMRAERRAELARGLTELIRLTGIAEDAAEMFFEGRR